MCETLNKTLKQDQFSNNDRSFCIVAVFLRGRDQGGLGPSNFWNSKKCAVSANVQWMRNAPSAAHLTVLLILCSSVKQNTRRIKGPWRGPCQLKKPFKAPTRRQGRCWVELRRTSFSLTRRFFKRKIFHLYGPQFLTACDHPASWRMSWSGGYLAAAGGKGGAAAPQYFRIFCNKPPPGDPW